jgi:hypothetical protein
MITEVRVVIHLGVEMITGAFTLFIAKEEMH